MRWSPRYNACIVGAIIETLIRRSSRLEVVQVPLPVEGSVWLEGAATPRLLCAREVAHRGVDAKLKGRDVLSQRADAAAREFARV